MKHLSLLFFLLSAAFAFAQPQFVSPGAEWWYAYKGGFIYAEGWHHIYYEKDTVVLNLPCKKLLRDNFNRFSNNDTVPFVKSTHPIFVRQTGDSVSLFLYNQWQLRWRTNPNVGDTYAIPPDDLGPGFVCNITVDSIKTINVNGAPVKKIHQHGTITLPPNIFVGSGHVVIYDRIGPEYSVFNYIQCWGAFDCFDSYLCRFKNDNIPLYYFNGFSCDVIQETSDTDGITLEPALAPVPNPCQEQVQFDLRNRPLKDITLTVVDQTGRPVQRHPLAENALNTLPTESLPNGVYYYFIRHSTGHFAGKFIKNEAE